LDLREDWGERLDEIEESDCRRRAKLAIMIPKQSVAQWSSASWKEGRKLTATHLGGIEPENLTDVEEEKE